MPLRKKVGYYGLRDLSYSIIDTSENSPNFFRVIEFPAKLKAGKNLIKLAANRDNLVNNSEIQIEILDYNGNPIYYEPLRYIEKDGTRVIAIYVYPDTSPGECTVYIAGRAQFDPSTGTEYTFSQNSNDANFFQVPNVIWSRTCNVAPNAANDVEIIFTQYPRVTISEIVQPYLQPTDLFNVFTQVTSSGNTATVTATATLNNTSTLTGNAAANPGTIGEGSTSPGTPSYGTQYFNTSKTQTSLSSTTSATTTSPILQTLNGYSVVTTTQPFFSASMTNGRMTIVNPQISVVSSTAGKSNLIYPGQQFDETTTDYSSGIRSLSGSYEFAITQVINSTTARIAQISGFADVEYDTLGSFSVQLRKTTNATTSTRAPQTYDPYVVNRIEPTSNFTASYIQPTLTIQTENSSSFADIILSNIEPATGDVYRIKTLFKPSGQFGDFIDLGDSILERTDVLIDTQSLETNVTVGAYYENFGIFEDLAEINQYWTGSALGTISTAAPLSISYDVDTLIGGAKITPTETTFQTNDAAIFSVKPQYQQQLYAGTEYIIIFNIATDPDITNFTTTNTNIPNPRLDVYISGSAISKQEAFTRVTTGNVETVTNFNATLNGNFQDNGRLGTRVGTYETTNVGGTVATVTFRFIANEYGPFDLKFVTRRGSFIVGNIQVLANKETGFSPNYVRINKRIPTEHLNTPLTFKFQFFNFRGDKADAEAIAYGAVFDGDNTYIDGTNNLLTGSVYIGNSIGSGVELAGVNSAYIRSIGYNGFNASTPGFMLWSGSVLPNSTTTYNGVGLELISDTNNYFRYRTNPSELDIHTETFFLGSDSQYISGANGNIAISSSNFYLDNAGNVTMAGTIRASAGTIGGWSIGSTYLSSSNLIIDSAGNLQTANYASDLTGWKISSAGNGFAEFENVKIRGTLSTAVFEKQSVNAVGGQLYVANSTVLTSSAEAGASTTGQYTATQTTMSVENVTGFEAGEIITAKKFSGTGFGTEYMRINSASRANPTSDTDFSGRIYVTRALGSGTLGNSGSLGETPGAGQTYSGSQVIVSTGKLGTGFIRINASPNDQATPYIDIVERTGSGIYDVKLKARLGDLSGLANSSYVFGNSVPGFGLATDNVFLQGGIIANFGNIGGFAITQDAITGSGFYLSGSATGNEFFISSSNFNVKGNGNVTASNALFAGVALADIIRDKTVVITAANSGSYLRTDNFGNVTTKTGYRIFLDGTYGGEKVRRVRITCNLLWPIGDFQLPNLSSTAKMEVVLENGVNGNQIYDVFTPTRSALTDPATITLANNDIMTFVAANTNATDWYCVAGNLQPFGNYTYKRGVIVTGSLDITGSVTLNKQRIDNDWTPYTPSWTAASSNPAIGNGSLEGWYKLVGKTCFVRGNIVIGSSTTFGSGEWYVSMPFTASHADAILMTANLLDNTTAWYNAVVNGARAGFNYKAAIQYQGGDGTAMAVNATQPYTWASSDRFLWNGSYEIA